MMNGGPISWKSRRQDKVSLSTSKAEFVAASQAGQEAIMATYVKREPIWIFSNSSHFSVEDNLACVAMSENPVC